MSSEVAITAWATWTSGGVSLGAAPRSAAPGAPLGAWEEAARLQEIHPRARRPHPSARQLVQLTHALLRARLAELPLARTGLVLGTSSGCAAPDREFLEQCMQRGPAFGSPSTFVYTLPTAAPGEVSIALGLRGGVETISAGAHSGLAALAAAAAKVARGSLGAAVCGALELPRTAEGEPGSAVPLEHLALFLLEPAGRAPAAAARLQLTAGGRPSVRTALGLAAHLAEHPSGPVVLDPAL